MTNQLTKQPRYLVTPIIKLYVFGDELGKSL